MGINIEKKSQDSSSQFKESMQFREDDSSPPDIENSSSSSFNDIQGGSKLGGV